MKAVEIQVEGDGQKFICEADNELLKTFCENYKKHNPKAKLATFTEIEMSQGEYDALSASVESARYFNSIEC